MIKNRNFFNKHLPVETQENKHWQNIFDLFNFIDNDTTAMPMTYF